MAQTGSVALVFTAALSVLLLCCSKHEEEKWSVPPAPLRPVPEALESTYAEILALRNARKYSEAAAAYPDLLEALAETWGSDNPDIAPFEYNHALALKLAGQPSRSLTRATEALRKWPDSLQLQVLAATLRGRRAILAGTFDSWADETFRDILQPKNLPRLRGLRLEPTALLGQWAEMLLRADRIEDALQAAERALGLDPGDRQALTVKGTILLLRKQPQLALPILTELAAEQSTPALELYTGMALLEMGEEARAWERFSGLLERRASPRDGALPENLGRLLSIQSGRALNRLGRPSEAAEILLGWLEEESENLEALSELANSVSQLGAREAAAALRRRARQLEPRDRLVKTAHQARTAGKISSVAYYEAVAALAVQRVGEAAACLRGGIERFPLVPKLHLESARLRLLLGRADLAMEDLLKGFRQTGVPWILCELARVAVVSGDPVRARSHLKQATEIRRRSAEGRSTERRRPSDESLFLGLKARALMALGAVADAKPVLLSGPAPRESEATLSLARAELAIIEGRREEASEILEGTFDNIPGGHLPGSESWANALRRLLAFGAPGLAGTPEDPTRSDPSDLLDHPRLLSTAIYPWRTGTDTASASREEAWRQQIRAAESRRREILRSMEKSSDQDVVPRWRELLSLYGEIGALRKAREAAWYLVSLRPGGLRDWRALAATLSSPDEVVTRLCVATTALRIDSQDTELLEVRQRAREFLGCPRQTR